MAKYWEIGDSITAADLNRTGGYGEVVLPTMTLSEINTILEEVEAEGGGTVIFKNGVYSFAGDLILPDRTGIIGESYGGCVIMFTGAYGIKANGTLKYDTGTITVARNSSTVTGQGTSFSTNVDVGDEVFILATYATVTDVVSDTELTIESNHVLDPITAGDYHVANPKESINISSLIIIGDGTGECLQMNYAKNCFLDKIIVSGGLVGVDVYGVSTVGMNDVVGQTNTTAFKAGMSGLISANGLSSLDATTNFDLDDLVACIYTNVAAFNGTSGILADRVRQSIIQSSGIGYFTGSGIDVNDCYELDIKGTYIHDCGTGIDIDSDSLRTKVANCTIQSNTTDITDAGTDTLITGNIGVPNKNVEITAPAKTVYTSGATWTKPAGLNYIEVELVAGGGGGGGGYDNVGGGGGAGGYSRKMIPAADLGATETVTVGAAGTAGADDFDETKNGGDGGTSSFGSHLSATGGGGGTGRGGDGGTGGSGSDGDINAGGQNGNKGNTTTSWGWGGNSFFGGGGCGNPRGAGRAYGAGGGGGIQSQTGSAGVAGVVIVTEY